MIRTDSIRRFSLLDYTEQNVFQREPSCRGLDGNIRLQEPGFSDFFRREINVIDSQMEQNWCFNRGSLIDYINSWNRKENVEELSKGFLGWIGGASEKEIQVRYDEILQKLRQNRMPIQEKAMRENTKPLLQAGIKPFAAKNKKLFKPLFRQNDIEIRYNKEELEYDDSLRYASQKLKLHVKVSRTDHLSDRLNAIFYSQSHEAPWSGLADKLKERRIDRATIYISCPERNFSFHNVKREVAKWQEGNLKLCNPATKPTFLPNRSKRNKF